MDFRLLTDDDLNAMRLAPKLIVNPRARWVIKGTHREKNFVLHDARDATQAYRIFLRVSSTNPSVFSVGLTRVWSAEMTLILARYNGPYHSHRNILERIKVPVGHHRHLATHRYINAGLDADGYAESVSDYNSVGSAFERLCRDCGIAWFESSSFQPELAV
ncbi:hypothetical protein [Caballeronia sp. LZ034LL]|uniref:hypothetical protein n=1 Tax=Caballeronia sp. LZ034LL TaxID=3038567 RepID=UPI002856B91C|nr:hypothetical protein [Caballeronia sp. LZ034LL]MDR5834987.1 hypothetical protein [Caballeronia sp. LZ034LL]